MADSTKDIVKADPIETLQRASKISLQGGGALLAVALFFVYMNHRGAPNWHVSDLVVLSLVVGAILSGLAGTFARVYDAKLRVQLSIELLEVKGTTDASKAVEFDDIFNKVLHGEPFVAYLLDPDQPNQPPRKVTLKMQ